MKEKVILLSSNRIGQGSDELGEGILETFLTVLKQQKELPVAIFLMNSGVLTITDDSLLSLQLKELEEKGVKILACKTCVDHYRIDDKLVAGEISGMAHFVELASKYEVLTIS